MQARKMKIAKLRKFYGGLISTQDNKTETYKNPFMPDPPAPAEDAPPVKSIPEKSNMSLSVYNKTEVLKRPKTAAVNIFKGVKGLEPLPVDEEGQPIPQVPVDDRIADM